jgi:CRP/FNR family transcriptional regulator
VDTSELDPAATARGRVPEVGLDLAVLARILRSPRRIRRGEHVYRSGDRFTSLYALRSGFFKSYADTPDGRTQVTSFPMLHDVVGLDGIGTGVHAVNVVALDDGQVCDIPYAQVQAASSRSMALQHEIHRMMSREIVREQVQLTMLGNLRAESRLAVFLLELSERYAARGYSSTEFVLRMTRDDIGNHLGLTVETVSRVLSKLQLQRLITARARSIMILDAPGLRELASSGT